MGQHGARQDTDTVQPDNPTCELHKALTQPLQNRLRCSAVCAGDGRCVHIHFGRYIRMCDGSGPSQHESDKPQACDKDPGIHRGAPTCKIWPEPGADTMCGELLKNIACGG